MSSGHYQSLPRFGWSTEIYILNFTLYPLLSLNATLEWLVRLPRHCCQSCTAIDHLPICSIVSTYTHTSTYVLARLCSIITVCRIKEVVVGRCRPRPRRHSRPNVVPDNEVKRHVVSIVGSFMIIYERLVRMRQYKWANHFFECLS